MKQQYFTVRLTAVLAAAALLLAVSPVHAQQSGAQKVDVVFLIDDTVSFKPNQGELAQVFSDLIVSLETSRPTVDFAFGVARFADYGGPGWDYCAGVSRPCADDYANRINGRPFILNQPVINATTAGSRDQRNALLSEAFLRANPFDWGGDDPETILEALYQVASGAGFDGDGDGAMTGSGGAQPAGASGTQISPDLSGDVPAFSSLSGVSVTGTLGGVGFRPDALKIVVVATDSCPAVAFPAGTAIPATILGRYSEELVTDFSCMGTTAGVQRFGFTGSSRGAAENTVEGAVIPLGGATLSAAVTALNAADIRVFGIGPEVRPVASGSQEASFDPGQWLSAIARITGGVDSQGNPLVFDLAAGPAPLREQILASIVTATDNPVNPGCQDVSLEQQLAAVESALKQQQQLLLQGARHLKRVGVKNKKMTAQRTFAQKTFARGQAAVSGFPQQVTVCSNLACDKVDRSQELRIMREAFTALDKRLVKVRRLVRGKKKLVKRVKKLQAAAAANAQQGLEAVGRLPSATNQCQAL